MAYYKWRRSTVSYDEEMTSGVPRSFSARYIAIDYAYSGGATFTLGNYKRLPNGPTSVSNQYVATSITPTVIYNTSDPWADWNYSKEMVECSGNGATRKVVASKGTSQGYVYSTNSSAYPNGGVSGDYYYDQRTTIVSPIAPNSITYPSSITNQSVFITFTEATSEIPDYSVDEYEISYNANESSWIVAGTTKELSYSFNIPSVFTSNIMFRVRAKDTNGQWGDYKTGAIASVSLPALPPPVLTLPSSPVKINESFSISWTSVSEATGYVLQKKTMNKDSDWSEVYNGSLLSCVDTVNDLGLRYRISYKVNNFQSEWSQEYYLNIFEKLIEISCLDESGSYIPLYPVTSTVAVFNTSDLVNLTLSTGTYQGNGFKTNSIALENSVDPKIAIITNSKQETTLVTNFNENNMTIKDSNNELGETYNYVIIGNNKNK